MREIKFRAWDNKNKYMVDSSFGNWISFDGVPYEEAYIKYNTPNVEIEKSKDLILLQFTGLKDKNGKDVYEGDIISTPKGICPVTFDLGCFYAVTVSKYRLGGWTTDCIEVIGNIHENPEQLNQTK